MTQSILKLFLMILISGTLCSSARAAQDRVFEANRKLGRGVSNVVFGPLEVFKGMNEAHKETNWIGGLTWGPIRGAGNMFRRMGTGLYEIATFPKPTKVIEKPEFVMPNEGSVKESPTNMNDPLLKP